MSDQLSRLLRTVFRSRDKDKSSPTTKCYWKCIFCESLNGKNIELRVVSFVLQASDALTIARQMSDYWVR